MWSSLWTRLGRRATFWSKLVAFSSVLHVGLLFFMFFVYSWQDSIFEIQINRSILKSGAPIIFLPPSLKSPVVRKKTTARQTVVKKRVTKKIPKRVSQKKPPTTIAKKKPAPKKPVPKKSVTKKAVAKKTPVKKPLAKKQPIKKQPVKKKPVPKKISEKKIEKKRVPAKPLKKEATPVPVAKPVQVPVTETAPEGPQPIYIGQKELEKLSVQYEIEREVAKHWRPPAGLSKDLTCTIRVLVDWNGKARQVMIKQTSGVLAYDIPARGAIARLQLPKSLRGKEIDITFSQ